MEFTMDSGVDFTNVPITTTLKGPTIGAPMAWPTPLNGYLYADTGNILNNDNEVFSLYTTNGGMTWISSKITDPSLQLQNIYFPTANVGYATGTLSDGSADFVAKTTDGGHSWNKIYSSTSYSFGNIGKLYFKDANNGMFFAQSNTTNKINIAYTTNGTSFTFLPMATDSTPYFLQWNNDGSWLVGIDSVYRSVDSGKNWKGVVPYDTLAGSATVATFYDSVGFVFRAIEAKVLETTDYGATWASSTLPLPAGGTKADTVTPVAASMPSPRVAYLLANDAFSTTDVMMQIEIPPSGSTGPGVVSVAPQDETSFTVYSDKSSLTFEASPPAPEQRTIEIVDLLGRKCATIAVPANVTSSHLASNTLQPGSYFARLGTAVVKFDIWE